MTKLHSFRALLFILLLMGLGTYSCKKKDTATAEPKVYKFKSPTVAYFTGWVENLYCTFREKADTNNRDTAQLITYSKYSYKIPNVSNPDQYRETMNFEYKNGIHLNDLRGEVFSYQGVDNFNISAVVDGVSFTNSIALDTTNTVVGGTDSTVIDLFINNYIVAHDTFGSVRRIEFRKLNGIIAQSGVSVPVNFGMYFKPRVGLIGYDIQVAAFPRRRYYLYSAHL